MIDKPILAIDSQVKNYEQIVKEGKNWTALNSFYSDRVGGLKQLVPLTGYTIPKWLNVTYKGSEIEKGNYGSCLLRWNLTLQVIAELPIGI